MNFDQIIAEAAKTAHKVYSLEGIGHITGKRHVFKCPKPVKVNRVKELKQKQDAERRERAAKIAELVGDNMHVCENANADLTGLLDPPKHVTIADKDLPVTLALILNK